MIESNAPAPVGAGLRAVFLDYGTVPIEKTRDLVLTVTNTTAAPVELAATMLIDQGAPTPFDASDYLWHHSDVGESGDYTCDGLDLLSVPEGDLLGTVSPTGDVLDWQGQLYDRD